VRLGKGCVLGPGVVLPSDTHLEGSILVASSEQSKESLEQDEGKCIVHRLQVLLFHSKEEQKVT
jgi:hypothetical protein